MSVIVAVDGSELSTSAARAGLDLLGGPTDVVLVTVVEPGDAMQITGTGIAGGVMSPEAFDEIEAAKREAGEAVAAEAATELGLSGAEQLVLRGDPGRSLCELAEARGARAIVLGTRGRGGLRRAVLGSVSDYVVRNAPCPVVVTNAADD